MIWHGQSCGVDSAQKRQFWAGCRHNLTRHSGQAPLELLTINLLPHGLKAGKEDLAGEHARIDKLEGSGL